ncbi:hypothetical protein [Intestinibacter sp.]
MKWIKKLVLMMVPVMFLVGCSSSSIESKNVSKEAIERNTMTKVQSDVNVIMDKSYDYVLKNMGSPYSTIYSLKIDKVSNFKDLEKMSHTNMENIEILSEGLLYPKYTSDYKLNGSALYIELKDEKVSEVETCDFKNLDVSLLKDENANTVISVYTDYNSLNSDNLNKENLNTYVGKEKNSISSIIKNKKCQYSIYIDVDGGINIDIYNIKDSDFLVVAYKDNIITSIEERDYKNIIDAIQKDIN